MEKKPSQKLQRSRVKIALALFLPLTLLSALLLMVLYIKNVATIQNEIKLKSENTLNLQKVQIRSSFRDNAADLLFFAESAHLLEWLSSPETGRRQLGNDFAHFGRVKNTYDQLRLLDTSGMEKIRINKTENSYQIIPDDQLQFKGDRYYFKECFSLNKGEIFVSPLDLNIENNQIEQPLKPMIRFGTPVLDQSGQKRGILVFNYLAGILITDLKRLATGSDGQFILLNSDGYWLIGSNHDEEWGFMYQDRKQNSMGNKNPEAWRLISASDSGQFLTENGFYAFETLHLNSVSNTPDAAASKAEPTVNAYKSNRDSFWKLVSFIPDSVIQAKMNTIKIKYGIVFSVILLLLAFVSLFAADKASAKKQREEELLRYSEQLEKDVQDRTTEIHNKTNELLEELEVRKKTEELLRLTRFSIDNSYDGLFWMTSDARIIDVNEAACRSLGYSREELLQLSIPDIDPLYNTDVWRQHFMDLRHHGSLKFETVHTAKDGIQFPVEIVANYIKFGTEECNCAIVRNIAERKQSEQALIESRLLLNSVVNGTPDAIYVKDLKGRYMLFNSSAEKFVGKSAAEVIGKDDTFLLPPAEAIAVMEGDRKVIEEGTVRSYEEVVTDVTGRITTFLSTKGPLFNTDGITFGLFGIARDITDRKQAEEEKLRFEQQFQHTQKLESLGVLSGGIAHDFNNILAIIMGYCSLTKLNYETAEKNIPIIEDAAERASGLCRQMMAYAGKAQLTMTKIDIVEKVDQIVSMLQATLPLNAVIKTDLSAEIPLIDGDSSQLGQVVMNLIINASEAIGTEQGKVDLSLSKIKVKAGKVYEDYHGKPIPPGEYVCLEVTDNGCGMDEETKWRIFEPFYTTKFTGRGLGMSAVLGIIKSHGGALQLFTQPGEGTTFKVYLPVPWKNSTGDAVQAVSAPSTPWTGSGTILLVEDEDQIRDIARSFLEMFGFTVLEAVNGREALEMYQKNAAEITLVVTDMGMPVMDGYELFHKLKSLDPELPIIVSSGYGDVEVSARIGSDNIAGIISKPYNPSQLREVLKSVMEGLGT